ncbi:glycosyltransferase family 2 protein [Psychromonas sp. KJ10-2]|uniref:glycosyltransferase family 2 protein n=1 Tax=Psychromonas sp. KJ10-2 TaxID=3391822 RepID=UPI0039B42B37
MKFIIISAVYNMADELKANIEILKQQDYTNFEVYFGDDLSTDNSCQVIEENIKDDKRFHLIKHQNKLFSMGNICTCIKAANPEDEDVIVLVDGDDKLSSTDVLSYLKEVYTKQQCLMTYGSYQSNGIKDKNCKGYPKFVARFNLFRYFKWRASHLKTFKYKLWNKINRGDLTITKAEYNKTIRRALLRGKIKTWLNFKKVKYEDIVTCCHAYVRRCDDKTFTLPMLEMAGERSIYIERVLYDYARQGAHDFGNSDKKWAQRFIRCSAFSKPKYSKVNFDK